MALSNAQRQSKWRKKNRVIYNLRRRNKRKNLRGDGIEIPPDVDMGQARPNNESPPPQLSTIEGLRELVKTVSAEPVEPVKLRVYRDDHNARLTCGDESEGKSND